MYHKLHSVLICVPLHCFTALSNEHTCPCKTVEVYYDTGVKEHPILGNYTIYNDTFSSSGKVLYRQIKSDDYWIMWKGNSWNIFLNFTSQSIAKLDRKGPCPYDYPDWEWSLYNFTQKRFVREKGLRVKCSSTSK